MPSPETDPGATRSESLTFDDDIERLGNQIGRAQHQPARNEHHGTFSTSLRVPDAVQRVAPLRGAVHH